jgi:hypothetical protein
VLGRDGFIYAADSYYSRVLRIDVVNNTYSFFGDGLANDRNDEWSAAILGNDGCIYWPPITFSRAIKYDPETQEVSLLVGDDFGDCGWMGGAVASDGVIYCMPSHASQVHAIDPFNEFAKALEAYMQEYSEELGYLFVKNSHGKTFYGCGVTKFGIDKVFQAIEECVPSLDAGREDCDLEPFMVAAACENSTTSVIYFLLRRNPDALLVIADYAFNSESENRKRKRG